MAVQANWLALEFASYELRGDGEIVLAAVNQVRGLGRGITWQSWCMRRTLLGESAAQSMPTVQYWRRMLY